MTTTAIQRRPAPASHRAPRRWWKGQTARRLPLRAPGDAEKHRTLVIAAIYQSLLG